MKFGELQVGMKFRRVMWDDTAGSLAIKIEELTEKTDGDIKWVGSGPQPLEVMSNARHLEGKRENESFYLPAGVNVTVAD